MNSRRARGFTLIELMVVVMVVAILAAIAIPSYLEQSRKGRRSEAMSAVGELQLRQERWRAENPSYADSTELATMGAIPTLPYYTITASGESETAYTITATPTGKQTGDRCGNLVLSWTAGSGKPLWSGDADCNN
ncbi:MULTISPECIES: type IV pilin protein [unclassified Lysobacter]|uniref:type IV pilin protein n=1 Tax=unclassified Lysobacter TaxID=2635362 RepID=UPI001F598DB0|nr:MULTISPECIES: type IV pilin protein [unclassified Lysobacter]